MLTQIGIPFEVVVPAVDETPMAGESAIAYVERMARSKAAAVPADGAVVLAADTVVVLEERILGKPGNASEGIRMLLDLGGRQHEVLTAIAVTDGVSLHAEVVRTGVRFVPVDEALARAYWATGDGSPSGRSSTARRWFSNWLVRAPSMLQCPELCGRIASSLTYSW